MNLAPIIIFTYFRPLHLRRTIESLKKNDLANCSDLIIFSDGPKEGTAINSVKKVRDYIRYVEGFKSIRIIEREKNLGLSNSIINGVTDSINEFGRVIVVEDDLACSKYFLKYMNDALNYYENEDNVISVHGYIYPVKKSLPETFFLKGADCWGWGTWKRGWELFETDGTKLLTELKNRKLTRRFDMNGAYPYTQMLEKQCTGKIDSWAIRWYASAFLKDKLTLYPGKSLVHNIGNDGSGTHCGNLNGFDAILIKKAIRVGGINVLEDKESFNEIASFLRKKQNRSFLASVRSLTKKLYYNLSDAYQNKKKL